MCLQAEKFVMLIYDLVLCAFEGNFTFALTTLLAKLAIINNHGQFALPAINCCARMRAQKWNGNARKWKSEIKKSEIQNPHKKYIYTVKRKVNSLQIAINLTFDFERYDTLIISQREWTWPKELPSCPAASLPVCHLREQNETHFTVSRRNLTKAWDRLRDRDILSRLYLYRSI